MYRVRELVVLGLARVADHGNVGLHRGRVVWEYPGNPRDVSDTGTSGVVPGSGCGSRKRRVAPRNHQETFRIRRASRKASGWASIADIRVQVLRSPHIPGT
jgi:hypothetical protein